MAGITLFDNEFTDKITRVPCPECGPVNAQGRSATTYVNVDDAITRGVEATLTAPLSEKLSLTSSYTYTYSKQKSGQYAGNPLNQMPEHMFNLGLDWKPTDKLNGWMKVTYRGKESDLTQASRPVRPWRLLRLTWIWAALMTSIRTSPCMQASTTSSTSRSAMTILVTWKMAAATGLA